MAHEFGKRRPPAVAEAPVNPGGGNILHAAGSVLASLPIPPIEPMQLLHCAGYCLLGYFLGMILFGTLLPQPAPEFARFVYVPAENRSDLIEESFQSPVRSIVPPGQN